MNMTKLNQGWMILLITPLVLLMYGTDVSAAPRPEDKNTPFENLQIDKSAIPNPQQGFVETDQDGASGDEYGRYYHNFSGGAYDAEGSVLDNNSNAITQGTPEDISTNGLSVATSDPDRACDDVINKTREDCDSEVAIPDSASTE